MRRGTGAVLFALLLAPGGFAAAQGEVADPIDAAVSAAGVSGEGIGPRRLSMPRAEVQKALPVKWPKGKLEESMADERYDQVGTAPAQGITLRFVATKKAGPFALGVTTVTAPCTAKTRRGIGSPLAELERAYGAFKNPGPTSATELRSGPGHYGMVFSLRAGKVPAIKMGEFGDGG